jgi:hypothetical protein
MSKWISIKERLPDNPNDLVLTYAGGLLGEYTGLSTDDPHWWRISKTRIGSRNLTELEQWGITHWMEMPKPPTDVNNV